MGEMEFDMIARQRERERKMVSVIKRKRIPF